MQVGTVCCVDIFTKYYIKTPFESDKSQTQGFLLSLPLTPFLSFLLKQPRFITCWGFPLS